MASVIGVVATQAELAIDTPQLRMCQRPGASRYACMEWGEWCAGCKANITQGPRRSKAAVLHSCIPKDSNE